MRRLHWLRALAMGALVSAAARGAEAHEITVDGNPADWFASATATPTNLGRVARDGTNRGEYIFRDAEGDSRTDLATPETAADLATFQVTGSAEGVAMLVRFVGTDNSVSPPVQVQIAIDTDGAAGSGQDFFAGFADTRVSNNARWERLVQTRFGSGQAPVVLGTDFNAVGNAQGARGSGVVELFVTWAQLGLSGPPATPLRFTVATFRAQPNDNTVAIGGSEVSNALDVMSDHNDPRAADFPNAFTELSDGVVDYHAAVFFQSSGEVAAPLLLTRLVPNAAADAGNEWVSIRNMTGAPISLAGWKLGDEETPDAGEAMYALPAATLAPGREFVVALSGANYRTYFGRGADAEFGTSDPDTPDLARYSAWANGSFALSNSEDEVVLLDPHNTLVDIAAYGGSTPLYGNARFAAPAASRVAHRIPALSDRDAAEDWAVTSVLCNNSTACGTCNTCGTTESYCAPAMTGTSCSDSNACNGAETCDGLGTCRPGTALVCNDGNPCTTDACDPAMGCTTAPTAAGTACDDSTVCNGRETCNGMGMCQPGTALSCTSTTPCTVGGCDAVMGCQTAPAPAGTACDDNDRCNGRETCNTTGMCVAGTAPTCDDNNPCTADSCDATMGCVHAPVAAGTSCTDGNACNGAEVCNGTGVCQPGTALVCNDGNPCTVDSCNPTTGCATALATPGTACDDNNLCNGRETCNSAGVCVAGTAVTCSPSTVDCRVNQCQPSSGMCALVAAPMGTSCEDGDICNGLGVCDNAGVCTVVAADGGSLCAPDAGPDAGEDAGTMVPDAGQPEDVPAVVDAGQDVPVAVDVGEDVPTVVDAGEDVPVAVDAGEDVTIVVDAGQPEDAGPVVDSAVGDDATTPEDAGMMMLPDGAMVPVDAADTDAATPEDTGMMMLPDGAMMPVDAGPRDAGRDSGATDAGMMMLPDGNMVPVDAGAPDAGGGAVGAEGGGCGCRAAGSTPGNRGGSLALLALGLGLVRRRRRNA